MLVTMMWTFGVEDLLRTSVVVTVLWTFGLKICRNLCVDDMMWTFGVEDL